MDRGALALTEATATPWCIVGVVRNVLCDPPMGSKHIFKSERTKATDIRTTSPNSSFFVRPITNS